MAQNTSSSGGKGNRTSGTSQSAQGGSGAISDVTGQARATAGQIADEAQQRAGQAVDTARHQVASQVSSQKDRAAEGLGSVAQALRQTGQQLREQDQIGVTQYIDRAADQVDRISGYLGRRDVGQLVDDVEDFARRQPALFLGGAFVLGLLGARFIKSSRPSAPYSGEYTGGAYMAQRQRRYYTGYPSEQDIREASAVPNYGPGTKSGPYSTTGDTMTGGPRAYDSRREE
jgi:uncharacterized protein YjbJ (UPF0337 family)